MAKSQKHTKTEHAEIPLEHKPRKSRSKKQAEQPAGLAPVIQELVETLPVKLAADLEPPERELVSPAPEQARPRPSHDKNGQERPISHAERVRPDGPRKREPGELANYFASEKLRMGHDGRTHQMEVVKGELTGDQKDYAAKNGLMPVDDEEKVWNGKQGEINRAGGDANAVAYLLGKNPDAGRAR